MCSMSLVGNVGFAQSLQLYKGVVVDADSGLIYIANPEGGLDGVELSSGNNRWHSDQADLPLMVQAGDLIAQTDNLEKGAIILRGLNTTTGAVRQMRSVVVPDSVKARVGHDLGERFDMIPVVSELTRPTLQWQYQKKIVKGMPDPAQDNLNESYGEITFNNGQTLIDASARLIPTKPNVGPVSIEGRFLDNIEERQFSSISKQYIIASERNADQTAWLRYQWTIYHNTGRQLGQINHVNSYVPFEVIDDLIIFVTLPSLRYEANNNKIESPLLLQAVSLSSGQTLWSREVKDLTYQGPYPQ